MVLPGEIPIEPALMKVFCPLKVIADPASRAKVAHAPSGTIVADATMWLALRDFLDWVTDFGRVTDDPLSKDMAVIARALPTMAESCPNVIAKEARMLPTISDEYPM